MKSKFFLTLIFAVLAISLSACGADSGTSSKDVEDSTVDESIDSKSSSSFEDEEQIDSSSSEDESSSSVGEPSSSSAEINLWTWNLPKEYRFNPDIEYGEMTDSRDNQTYKIVKIGNQVWMAENLNYETENIESFCHHDYVDSIPEETLCSIAGRLYTWAAAIDSITLANKKDGAMTCGDGVQCSLEGVVQGVCPEGWHLPSEDEWEILFESVGGLDSVSSALRSITGWGYGYKMGSDSYGFSAIPAGNREFNLDGDFVATRAGDQARFWSSTPSAELNGVRDSTRACGYILDNSQYFYGTVNLQKRNAISVRCVKNSESNTGLTPQKDE